MPRPNRRVIPGVSMHITQRGNNRVRIFYDDEDCTRFAGLLIRYADEYDVDVHAWCFMPNHIHLLVTPMDEKGVAQMMAQTTGTYATYFNRRHKRTGALYERRYFSSLAAEPKYIMNLYRYIELNPVKAKLCKRPHDWHWSSYGANAYGKPSNLLTPHPLFLMQGETDEEIQRAYRDFIYSKKVDSDEYAAIRADIKSAQRRNTAYGSKQFVESYFPPKRKRTKEKA